MVKRILDFENFVNEGLIMTYPIDKIVSYVQRKLNLTNDDVDIFFSQTNQECIAVDNSLSTSMISKIETILKLGGYNFSHANANNSILFYNKKYGSIADLTGVEYVYHITPSKNDVKIKKNGLIPVNKNKDYNYSGRVFLLSDKNLNSNSNFFLDFCKHLHKESKKDIFHFSVYQIDVNKLKHMKIYIAPNAYDYIGFYTMENIKPEYLKKIDEIILLKNE